jgi:hypothetical protein
VNWFETAIVYAGIVAVLLFVAAALGWLDLDEDDDDA